MGKGEAAHGLTSTAAKVTLQFRSFWGLLELENLKRSAEDAHSARLCEASRSLRLGVELFMPSLRPVRKWRNARLGTLAFCVDSINEIERSTLKHRRQMQQRARKWGALCLLALVKAILLREASAYLRRPLRLRLLQFHPLPFHLPVCRLRREAWWSRCCRRSMARSSP